MGSVRRNIWLKILLAAISGLCCGLVYEFCVMDEEIDPVTGLGVLGVLFAAGVLFPYLSRNRSAWPRGIGLIGISMLSFLCATSVFQAVSGPYIVTTTGFVAASVVGAAIVLTGAMFIIPLRRSFVLALTGVPAAIVGGLAFLLIDGPLPGLPLPFMIWHLLMAVAIHIAEYRPSSEPEIG